MTKRTKYLLILIITILFVGGGITYLNTKNNKTGIINIEKTSEEYKITEDLVILNVNQEENKNSIASSNKEPENLIVPETALLKIEELSLSSSDFQNLESIPLRYTCDGENINPNLKISGVNQEAKSLVLVMEDHDASDVTWDHWIKFNIPIDTKEIRAGEGVVGISGKGTGGNLEYSGPCPPETEHNYIFKLYTLDTELLLAEGVSKIELMEAMQEHILQETTLTGVYTRQIDLVVEEVIE